MAGLLQAYGQSTAGQTFADVTKNMVGVAKAGMEMEQQGLENQYRQAGVDIAKAQETRAQAEFDQKQKIATRRLPLTLRWGPMETWSNSRKAIVEEGRKMGLVEDVGGIPTASPNDYKTFIESVDPSKAVEFSAMNLSEHASDMGEIQKKLAANPEDPKLIAERDRIIGLYTTQKTGHDTLVDAIAAKKRAEEGGGKSNVKGFDPESKRPVIEDAKGNLWMDGKPYMGGQMSPVTASADRWIDENRTIQGKAVEGQRNTTTNEWKARAQGQNISINMPTSEESSNIVQMIHDNGLDPTQVPKRGGTWNKVMSDWKKAYPDENINDYAAFAKWKRDISVNKSMALLDSIPPVLDKMLALHKKLGFGRFTDYNKLMAYVKDHTGNPEIAEYETYMRNVVQELPTAMTTYFPTDTRINMEIKNLVAAKAPGQIEGNVNAIKDLVSIRREQFASPSWSPLMKNQIKPATTGVVPRSPGEAVADYLKRTSGK